MKLCESLFLTACAVLAHIGYASAPEGVPIDPKVDHRGLIEIPGILRSHSGFHWGAANLVAFGKDWGYSAQDYALKNIKKDGNASDLSVSGNLSVPGCSEIIVDERIRKKGAGRWEVTWKLSSTAADNPMQIRRAYLSFPLAVSDYEGTVFDAGRAGKYELPARKPESGVIFEYKPTDSIEVTTRADAAGKSKRFRIEGKDMLVSLLDCRKTDAQGKTTDERYELRMDFKNPFNSPSCSLVFDMQAEFPPFKITASPEWMEYRHSNTVVPGSILDFSEIGNRAYPDTDGRLLPSENGRFVTEKTGREIRLIGANLCFSACFPDHDLADKIVADFKKMGYNAVRFHHTDVIMMKGEWNGFWEKKTRGEISPSQLEKLDYLMAAMKKAGMYVTIDLYAMGCMGMIDGVDKSVFGEIKALVPIHEPAFEVWAQNALEWMNHVNPYTGLAWKEDPAVFAICPLNEDSIASVWRSAEDKYMKAFSEWKKNRTGRSDDQLMAQFLTEVKVKSNKRILEFFKKNGIKASMSGCNWWDTMAQTFERDSLQVVDNHQYSDHPTPHYLPSRYNQHTNLKNTGPTYMTPIFMAATRQFDKPFIVTEYNFCAPNIYRAEGGAMMGAYASLQDWSGLFRFAWAHDSKLLKEQHPISGFDIVTDPVSQMTERQIMLMFGRRDVRPAEKSYVYAVTMDEATENGIGDMWSRGLFPHDFNALALKSRIGSAAVYSKESVIPSGCSFIVAAKGTGIPTAQDAQFIRKNELDKFSPTVTVSDTGEIALDSRNGSISVSSLRTECIVVPSGKAGSAGGLSVSNVTQFCSISASSMDKSDSLRDSSRILIFHITNVMNTDMSFSDSTLKILHRSGTLPYLIASGAADVSLKNTNPNLKLYAVGSNGVRLCEVPLSYSDGEYKFRLDTASPLHDPTMVYELSAE